jgi:A-factor type gamma-butyrolactone 1'-reductase (1S-forming)
MGFLEERTALITGAGAGIGRQTALVFAREGAAVALGDSDAQSGEETAELVRKAGGTALFVTTDITRRPDVEALIKAAVSAFGKLDCAFNNAGVTGPLHPLVGYPDDAFERVLSVNLVGTWYCLQAEIPAMLDVGGGVIVNAASSLGTVGAPGMPAYVATKHAILGLTRAAALEHARDGIRINAVLPGVIDTNMPARLSEGHPELMEALLGATPTGRLGRPEEIAEAVAWMCSDRASYMTGHGLAVDGGYLTQ